MIGRRLQPPAGGEEPPGISAPLGAGEPLDLKSLATRICQQYRDEFPDEHQRYGDAGNAWCVHDNQHLLNWGVETVNGYFDIKQEVAWLANVLAARHFPTDRLARTLDIGAGVVLDQVTGPPAQQLATVLADTATFVRSGSYVDYVADED